MTGSEDVDYYRYIYDRFLSGRSPLTGLSLGCGTGHRERTWASLGGFRCIDAYDVSAPRIQEAQERARIEGYESILHYHVGNVYSLGLPRDRYDVVFLEQSLHHFSPVDELLDLVAASMHPDGILVVNEFVGPSRFQWTDRQMQVINGLLSVLPERFRREWERGVKSRQVRWSRLRMILSDPSEAVESSRIPAALRGRFEIVEWKSYGGTVLQMLLHGIAHNFVEEPDGERWLNILFDVEDALLASGDLESDFIVAVCRIR